MTGQIPPYGAHYVLVTRDEYSPTFTHSIYRNRQIPDWEIWAEKGSKDWWIMYTGQPVSGTFPSLTRAMSALNSAITALYPTTMKGASNASQH